MGRETSTRTNALRTTRGPIALVIALAALLALAASIAAAQPAAGKADTKGRTVVGKIVLKKGSDPDFDLTKCVGTLTAPESGVTRPIAVQRDGAFRVEGLPAGKYDVVVDADLGAESGTTSLAEKLMDEPGAAGATATVGRVRFRFEVSAPEAKDAAQPKDLGKFDIDVPKTLTGKEAAPDFTVVTMDGEEFSLKAQRGKYVLVEFWASWCGYCRTETPFVKAIHTEFGQDPRLAMVSLSLDKEIEKGEEYAKKNGMTWPQGVLGNWSRDKTSLAYGIREVPTFVLIAPDGKIVAQSASGKAIRERVAQALAKKDGDGKVK